MTKATKTQKTTKAKAKKATKSAKPKAEEPVVASSSVVKSRFKERARSTGGILRDDRIGQAIRNFFLAQDGKLTADQQGRAAVDKLLAANSLEVGAWSGKNTGMLRMNVTNVARGMLRRGEGFTVDGKTYDEKALERVKHVEAKAA